MFVAFDAYTVDISKWYRRLLVSVTTERLVTWFFHA